MFVGNKDPNKIGTCIGIEIHNVFMHGLVIGEE
jgi:hypothetical protein